jgi:hypothetical protein
MSNPIYNNFNNNQVNPFAQIIQEAKNFKNTFKGSPKDEVQRLLNSGQMSQQQFNQFSQIAQQVLQAMGGQF